MIPMRNLPYRMILFGRKLKKRYLLKNTRYIFVQYKKPTLIGFLY